MIFKEYQLPVDFEEDQLSLHISLKNNWINYVRTIGEQITEKQIIFHEEKILIHPVEPMLYPKDITRLLMIELKTPVSIRPRQKAQLFLTFPIDIGVFHSNRSVIDPVDVFTLAKSKLTLYGDPDTGVICRYWQSDLHSEIPETDPLREGALNLSLKNDMTSSVQVSRVILNAAGMKIFFDDKKTMMQASMRVTGKKLAETVIETKPPNKGMTSSRELFSQGLVKSLTSKYIMEGDL